MANEPNGSFFMPENRSYKLAASRTSANKSRIRTTQIRYTHDELGGGRFPTASRVRTLNPHVNDLYKIDTGQFLQMHTKNT